MHKIVWMQQAGMEPFAGGQQQALRRALEAAGHEIVMHRYQPRAPWRLAGACDWLIWSFVPSQLDVWSARLLAKSQMAVIHEISPGLSSLPKLEGWCVPSESLRMQLIDCGISHERVCISTGYAPAPLVNERAKAPIIYVGGPLHASTGNRLAIWALSIFQYLHPQACMVLHGDGDDQERIVKLAAALCAADSVKWAPSDAGVHGLVEQSDIVMLPRLRDGVPDALFSACMLGKPILATPQPSLMEWLRHDVNALLLSGEQPPAWSAAIDRLVTDSRLAERLGRAARSTAVPKSRMLLPAWMQVTEIRQAVRVAA